MNRLLETFLCNRKGLLLSLIALILTGNYLVTQLPITLYPNTTKTRIWVRIPHPSFTAEEFSTQYADRLLSAINTVEGIEEVESNFSNGSTQLRVYFEWGFDSREARSLVSAAMAQVRPELPEESENYSVAYWAGRTSGFLAIAATSDEFTAEEIFELIEPRLKPQLTRMRNMNIARINPVTETRVEIIVRPKDLINFAMTPDGIANAIRQGYRNISLGSFRDGFDVWTAKVRRHSDSLEDIENIVIEVRDSTEIKLSDVADVDIIQGLPRHLHSVNGSQAVVIFAMPEEGGNVREMAQTINGFINEAKKDLPESIEFISLVDPGVFVNRAVGNVINAALIGGTMAILVVFIFLGEIRNTITIALAIPLSIVVSFILMYLFDVTINLISLGGLTLAVGMIIDSSIVVTENIHRHRREARERGGDDSLMTVIIKAVSEVRSAIIASTLTSIVVFLPISFTSELTAAILGDLALAVVFALCCSLLVALFVAPCLSYTLIRASDDVSNEGIKSHWMDPVKDFYQGILRKILSSRTVALAVIVASFALLIIVVVVWFPKIDREIIAKPDSNRITLRFTNTESRTQEELLAAIRPIEARIMDDYEELIENLFTRIHGSTSGAVTLTVNSTSIRDKVIGRLQDDFPSSRQWRFNVTRWDPAELPLPRTYDLKIAFNGPDKRRVLAYMEDAVDLIRAQGVYATVDTEPTTQLTPEISLKPRYPLVASAGSVRVEDLARSLRILLSGGRVIRTIYENEPLDIELTFEENFISNAQELENFQVPHGGGSVRLAHFFDFDFDRTLTEVVQINEDPIYNVTADLALGASGREREHHEDAVRQVVAENLVLDEGYSYSFQDTQEEINRAIGALFIALTASIVLIFVILGAQFNSFILPFVVLSAVPLGLIGVVSALYLANSTVSLNSMLGTILLGGIVVNNSILLVDFFRNKRRDFASNMETILHCCRLRLTPIVITTLTTIFGMMPIALAFGDGTNVVQPLGIAVTGGLGISSLFTLFVTPCILSLLPEDIVK